MSEDINRDEAQLLDSIRWEIDNVQFIPEGADRHKLKDLHKYYESIVILAREKIHEKTALKKEWSKLRKLAGRKLNEIQNELCECNIEKRTMASEKYLGDRIIGAVIGILRHHGWTVEPPERNE